MLRGETGSMTDDFEMQAPLIVSHTVPPQALQAPSLLPGHSLLTDETMNVPIGQHGNSWACNVHCSATTAATHAQSFVEGYSSPYHRNPGT